METSFKEMAEIAEKLGVEKERLRIAKVFYDYPRREEIPLEIQKDIIRIITVDIEL